MAFVRGLSEREGRRIKVALSAAWHGAAFERSRKMPPLQSVIGQIGRRDPAEVWQPKSSAEIVKVLKARFGVKSDG